jgi:purine catabolism regulator
MTLQNLIENSQLKNLRYIGDTNLIHTEISSVNIIDNPDVIKWIKKGELVLTTGYFFQDNESLALSMIRELAQLECAALAIKIKRFFQEIPQSFIDTAYEVGLPIIEIPYFYAFSEIMDSVFSKLYQEKLDKSLYEYTLLNSLMKQLQEKAGLDSMLTSISDYVCAPVFLMDNECNLIIQSQSNSLQKIQTIVIDHNTGQTIPTPEYGKYTQFLLNGHSRTVFQLYFHTYPVFLCVVTDGNILTNENYHTLINTLTILEIEFYNHLDSYNIKHSNQRSFLDVLTSEQSYTRSELIDFCEYFSFPYKAGRTCSIFHLTNSDSVDRKKQDLSIVEKQIRSFITRNKNYYLCANEDYLTLFSFYPPDANSFESVMSTKQTLTKWYYEMIPYLHSKLYIGVSTFTNTLESIKISFYDSLRTVHFYKFKDMPPIIVHHEQQFYHLLIQKTDIELRNMISQTIGPLVAYNQKYPNQELITTLKTYFQCRFNSTETAKKLFLHRNTLLNRMEKIKSILPVPEEEFCQYSYFLGICAYEILESRTI